MKNNLFEHVINLWDIQSKEKYADQVWKMLQKSYEKIGGFGSATSPEELVYDSGLWKLIIRNGSISAGKIYKDAYGRKGIGTLTNGSDQGKKDFKMITKDDMEYHRAWGEISGAVEHLMKKYGGFPIPSKYAHVLTHKEILDYNEDGYHYARLIAGIPHEKVIYGWIDPSPEEIEELKNKNILLKDLDH